MIRLIIFASGSGTNAENIIRYFKNNKKVYIKAVLSNKKDAKVLEKAFQFGIETRVFSRKELYDSENILQYLKKEADFLILAGFLWKIPGNIIQAFPNRIINIHPALLPLYGGKGMYGMNIHKAVVANNESCTGITIHFVNENYDEGAIIFQKKVMLSKNDTPKTVAEKIHQLEQDNFPTVIESVLYKMK